MLKDSRTSYGWISIVFHWSAAAGVIALYLLGDAIHKAPDREAMIAAFQDSLPLLGVCLGHQCLVQHFGGEIVRAPRLMHGKTSDARHDGKRLFDGISQPMEVGRYHSLCAEHGTLPAELEVTAETDRGEIMGVRHKRLPLEGVQFHPESVLTPEGNRLMANFLRMAPGGER